MAYDATNDFSALDETRPNGATEQVDILDDALREIRRTTKAVIQNEHTSTGVHKLKCIVTAYVADGAIDTLQIADNAVKVAKIPDAEITGAKLANGTVTTTQIANGTITGTDIADATIVNANITDKTILVAKLAAAASAKLMASQADGSWAEVTPSGAVSMTAAGVFTLVSALSVSFVILSDGKALGTNGGTFTTGVDTQRDLNSLYDPSAISGLAANQFTLPAGTFIVIGMVPAYQVGLHQAWLRNVTDGSDALIGSSSASALGNQTFSYLLGQVTITATKTFQINHRCQYTQATNGLGVASSLKTEKYTQIAIIKL